MVTLPNSAEPTPEEVAFLESFISTRYWKWASTYAKTHPHWYTIRIWKKEIGDLADFSRFIAILRRCGYTQPFYKMLIRYFNFKGFKYWTMGAPVNETTVINRVPLPAEDTE